MTEKLQQTDEVRRCVPAKNNRTKWVKRQQLQNMFRNEDLPDPFSACGGSPGKDKQLLTGTNSENTTIQELIPGLGQKQPGIGSEIWIWSYVCLMRWKTWRRGGGVSRPDRTQVLLLTWPAGSSFTPVLIQTNACHREQQTTWDYNSLHTRRRREAAESDHRVV